MSSRGDDCTEQEEQHRTHPVGEMFANEVLCGNLSANKKECNTELMGAYTPGTEREELHGTFRAITLNCNYISYGISFYEQKIIKGAYHLPIITLIGKFAKTQYHGNKRHHTRYYQLRL